VSVPWGYVTKFRSRGLRLPNRRTAGFRTWLRSPPGTDAATTTAEPGKAKAAPERDQIEATKDGKANVERVPSTLQPESPVAVVGSSWETAWYVVIVGLLLVAMAASILVIYIRGPKVLGWKEHTLRPGRNPVELPARPVVGHALSPEAALARIEEIRRSLLDLAASPSLAPSAIPEEPMLPTLLAERRLKFVESV
jgi:hypothetical protein